MQSVDKPDETANVECPVISENSACPCYKFEDGESMSALIENEFTSCRFRVERYKAELNPIKFNRTAILDAEENSSVSSLIECESFKTRENWLSL